MKLLTLLIIVYISLVHFLQCQTEISNTILNNNRNNYNKIARGRCLQEGKGNGCAEEKVKLNLEKSKVEKNLQQCLDLNKQEQEKHKESVADFKKKINECKEKKNELETKLKQSHEHGGNGGAHAVCENERNELKNKIKKLEDKLKEKFNGKEGGKSTENYLISYEIFKNYIWKIYKVYKTFYIVLTDMNAVTNLKEKAIIYKNTFLKKLKEAGYIVREKWNIGVRILLANNNTKKVLVFMNNIITNKYIILIKDNLEEIGRGVKGPLFDLILSYKPQIYIFQDNLKTNYYFVSSRLQKGSDSLLSYLYSINPEIKGIIPTKLHDQVILLIFLTIVNLIILYSFFYFFYVIFRFVKTVILFSLRTVWGIIAWVFKPIFFIITLPIRPCLKRKENKHRKVYKSHKEDARNAPDRNYQQSDFKKSNREHYVKHRR